MAELSATTANSISLLSSLRDFCEDSVSTCFSSGAGELCVSIGLSCASALFLLLSCFLLVYQRCTTRRENPGETSTSLYSFLGHLCSTVGAILSKQLQIQILMGACAAAVDALHVISCCLHVLLCWNSKAEKRRRMVRSRRRQHLCAVCVLMLVAGGFFEPMTTQLQSETRLSRRKLLQVTLQDNTEILGYSLGLLSFVIACTSRFPAARRAYNQQMFTWAYLLSSLLCSLAGSLYSAAILLYDTRLTSVLRVMPWLTSAICCAILDLLIVLVCWCKSGTRRQLTIFSADTESLLGVSGLRLEDNVKKRQRKLEATPEQTEKLQKMTEMGRYLDVSARPAGKEVTLAKEEEIDNCPCHEMEQMIRVSSFCHSDTSFDSSLESSDLEWDFEEANAPWNKPSATLPKGGEFPLRGWPIHANFCKLCNFAMARLPQKTLSRKDDNK